MDYALLAHLAQKTEGRRRRRPSISSPPRHWRPPKRTCACRRRRRRIRGQLDLQDHQRPGRRSRSRRSRTSIALAYESGVQGLHHLSPERGHRLGPHRRAGAGDSGRRRRVSAARPRRRWRGGLHVPSRSSAPRRCSERHLQAANGPRARTRSTSRSTTSSRAGGRRPFEVFINSKNMEHYAWTVALTRMISAVFRRGGDVTFVVRGAEGGVRSAGRRLAEAATCRRSWPRSAASSSGIWSRSAFSSPAQA